MEKTIILEMGNFGILVEKKDIDGEYMESAEDIITYYGVVN